MLNIRAIGCPIVNSLVLLYSLVAVAQATDHTILFVDDHDVLYRSGTQRILQQPTRHAKSAILTETKPWELAIGYCSVHHNPVTGRYQAWYQAYAGGRAKQASRRVVLCYATSADGVNWQKPALGLFDFNGDEATNIVLVGNGLRSVNYGASVLYDANEPNALRRYKLAYWDFVNVKGRDVPGLCVAFSADGIHWEKYIAPPLLQGAYGEPGPPPLVRESEGLPQPRPAISDVIDVMFDSKRDRYVIYSKTWIDAPSGDRFWKRAVVRTESENFVDWTPPTLVLTASDDDSGQLHGAPVFLHAGVYFGLLQRLDFGGFDRGGTGNMPAELATSRDGIEWRRSYSSRSFLPVTGDGETFDAGCLWTNSTPVILPDEIRFYYGAYPSWTADVERSKSGIGLFTLPRDRFVAIQPRGKQGQITLKPIRLSPEMRISVNADARGGEIQIELLDSSGYRVSGYTKDQSMPLADDNLKHPVRWRKSRLADLPSEGYQIRIHLTNAKIFAITIQDD
ncbi:MAG: hypothetical protein P8N76_24275 [Pirellulaceae bacterium]|nr:hypothetical protein [Pirellulaceae bacterium]